MYARASCINTPSTGSQPHQASQYDVALGIPCGQQTPLYRGTLAVLEAQLLQMQGFHALIGRDVLAACLLTYNGGTRLFTLAY